MIKRCKVCQKHQPNKRKPELSILKAKGFNDVVMLDLKIKIDGKNYILWMIDSFTRYTKGVVMKSKHALEIIKEF